MKFSLFVRESVTQPVEHLSDIVHSCVTLKVKDRKPGSQTAGVTIGRIGHLNSESPLLAKCECTYKEYLTEV